MSGTPKPWRAGSLSGVVVSDQPNPEREYGSEYPWRPEDEVAGYGGYLVCESVMPGDLVDIICDGNSHDKLVAALRDAAERLDGAADFADPLDANTIHEWASEARTIANTHA